MKQWSKYQRAKGFIYVALTLSKSLKVSQTTSCGSCGSCGCHHSLKRKGKFWADIKSNLACHICCPLVILAPAKYV